MSVKKIVEPRVAAPRAVLPRAAGRTPAGARRAPGPGVATAATDDDRTDHAPPEARATQGELRPREIPPARPPGPRGAPRFGRVAELPAADFLEERLVGSMTALENPHAQPEIDPETLLFTPDAALYTFCAADLVPLLGPAERPNYRQVRFDVGPVGAALAALAAADPERVRKLVGALSEAGDGPAQAAAILYDVRLRLPRREAPAGEPIRILVDGLLPAAAHGTLLGMPQRCPPPPNVDLAAWPYVVLKAMLKLLEVWRLSHPQTLGRLEFGNIVGLLSGRTPTTVVLAQRGARQRAHALCLEMARSWAPQAPEGHRLLGGVCFRDATDLSFSPPLLRDHRLQALLGGLGVRVQLLRGALDVVLLAHHTYSIVGFDNPHAPTRVRLYNPLSYNPQTLRSPDRVRQADFFVPEDLAALPRAQGTFWLPIEALVALSHQLTVGPASP